MGAVDQRRRWCAAARRRRRSGDRMPGRSTLTTTSRGGRVAVAGSVAACTCAIDAEASGVVSKLANATVDRAAERLLDQRARGVAVERRDAILQQRQFLGDVRRHQVAAGRQDLPELDEDRPEFLQRQAQARAARQRRDLARRARNERAHQAQPAFGRRVVEQVVEPIAQQHAADAQCAQRRTSCAATPRLQARDARREALDVVAQRIDIVVEGIQLVAADDVARFLGQVFGRGLGEVARRRRAPASARRRRRWRSARRARRRTPPRTAAANPDRTARPGAAGGVRVRHRRTRAGDRPGGASSRRNIGSCATSAPSVLRTLRSGSPSSHRPARPRGVRHRPRTCIASGGCSIAARSRWPSSARKPSRVSGSSASARLSAASSVRPASGFQWKGDGVIAAFYRVRCERPTTESAVRRRRMRPTDPGRARLAINSRGTRRQPPGLRRSSPAAHSRNRASPGAMSYQCVVPAARQENASAAARRATATASTTLRRSRRWRTPAETAASCRPAARRRRASSALTISRAGRGSPLLMKYARPAHAAPGAGGRTHPGAPVRHCRYTWCRSGCRHCRRCAGDRRARARTSRGSSCWSPGPQIRRGRSAMVASPGVVGRKHRLLGDRLRRRVRGLEMGAVRHGVGGAAFDRMRRAMGDARCRGVDEACDRHARGRRR